MKKIISAAAVLAAMGVLTVSAYADVYVSIADENGKLVDVEKLELDDKAIEVPFSKKAASRTKSRIAKANNAAK